MNMIYFKILLEFLIKKSLIRAENLFFLSINPSHEKIEIEISNFNKKKVFVSKFIYRISL